jgi:hypothetical protein
MDPNQFTLSNLGSEYACHSPCSSISSNQTTQFKQQHQIQYDKINTVLNEMNAANRNFSTKLKSFTSTNSQQHLGNGSSVPRTFLSSVDPNQNQVEKRPLFNNQYLTSQHDVGSLIPSTVTPFLMFTNNSIDDIYNDKVIRLF